jgi:hypothetical protein
MSRREVIIRNCVSEGELYRLSHFSTDKSYEWLWQNVHKAAVPVIKGVTKSDEFDVSLVRDTITPCHEPGRFIHYTERETPQVVDCIISPGNLLVVTSEKLMELSRGDVVVISKEYQIGFQSSAPIVIYRFEVLEAKGEK